MFKCFFYWLHCRPYSKLFDPIFALWGQNWDKDMSLTHILCKKALPQENTAPPF